MRQVRIRDTLTGELKDVQADQEVGIYACGPTVYGRIHIGNARPFVVFSLIARFLRHEGYPTRLIMNITDINDKIYSAAAEAGAESTAFAEEMTRAYIADTDRLGLGRPDAEPLASRTMREIVELIEALIASGHAYQANGDVYFRVRSFVGYGKLSNRKPEHWDQGEEAGEESLKEDPIDFALWKGQKPGEDSAWDSPWGRGRPGWHIECSAMAEAQLGLNFAIHGGGSDLIFPHHENEIAQSEAARRAPLARIWMHNGMVEIQEEKMSKSEGNIFQLSEALDRFGRETIVSYLISGHYRQPLGFSQRALLEESARVEGMRNFLRENPPAKPAVETAEAPQRPDPEVAALEERFLDALADDFNTPRALAAVAELVAEGNRRPLAGAADALLSMLELLGLGSLAQLEQPDEEALTLLAEREAARRARDFSRADLIRDRLAADGWEVRDTPAGARLVRRG